jgi:hypothetical protein
MPSLRTLALLALLGSACATDPVDAGDAEDGEHDSAGGKSDSIAEGSRESGAILALVNDPAISPRDLDYEAGLSLRVATLIVEHRDGYDQTPGTDDDNLIDDLAELDAIPYVGSNTMKALLGYAKQEGLMLDQARRPRTRIDGVIESQTWSPTQGPYEIGDVRVLAGTTLRITPGTTVFAKDSDAGLFIGTGDVVIHGVRSAPVRMIGEGGVPGDAWRGVHVEDAHAPSQDLSYVTLTNASNPILYRGPADSTFHNITVTGFGWQGIDVGSGEGVATGTLTIDGLIASDAPDATAASTHGGKLVLRNCLLANASYGLQVTDGGSASITNCTVAHNNVGIDNESTLTISNSIIANHVIGVASTGTTTIDHTDLFASQRDEAFASGDGNVAVDPAFVSPTNLHLRAGSPCVGLGTGGIERDLDGKPRPAHSTLGAFER